MTPAPASSTAPDIAVAERQRLIELAEDGFERGREAVGPRPCRAPGAPCPAAGAPCRSSPALPKSTSMRSVPAETSVRERADQHLPPRRRRARYFGHLGGAGLEGLKDLFHFTTLRHNMHPVGAFCLHVAQRYKVANCHRYNGVRCRLAASGVRRSDASGIWLTARCGKRVSFATIQPHIKKLERTHAIDVGPQP